jgi:hypothetical protein
MPFDSKIHSSLLPVIHFAIYPKMEKNGMVKLNTRITISVFKKLVQNSLCHYQNIDNIVVSFFNELHWFLSKRGRKRGGGQQVC